MDTTEKPLLILQELFGDTSFMFRVHNVKITSIDTAYDLPQMFLAHYDSLADEIKANLPLSTTLLKQINKKMTSNQACTLLGLPADSIRPAWHIKISGTAVIVCDALSLAIHSQFTNTAKSHQATYGNPDTLIKQEADKWQLSGNVNLLFKNPSYQLTSVDLQGEILNIKPYNGYVKLPNSHALATTHAINALKHGQPDTLSYLHNAIIQKATAKGL